MFIENHGYCPACASETVFSSQYDWLRDHYKCANCGSIPRERALMRVIETRFPNWRELRIHESSTNGTGASAKLRTECPAYLPTWFFPDKPLGAVIDGQRCENLETLTFPDASFDLHVTQDVMEHVFDPTAAWKEIARTLAPGGAHVFTVPLHNKEKPSRRRAELVRGNVRHLIEPPVYHGNPISENGALLTFDWGFDIGRHIFDACGLYTQMIVIDDLSMGIRAEYIEVLVTSKP